MEVWTTTRSDGAIGEKVTAHIAASQHHRQFMAAVEVNVMHLVTEHPCQPQGR